MKLSAKVEYALWAVTELASGYQGSSPVRISSIAKAHRIPKNFLLQILIRLKNAGIVESARGVSGGYFLAKHPSKIRVADVIRAVDEGIVSYQKGIGSSRASDTVRVITSFWNGLNKEIVRRLESVTFEELSLEIKRPLVTYDI